MPLGYSAWPQNRTQAPLVGPLRAPPLGAGGLPYPGGQTETPGVGDTWQNRTLLPDATTWPGGLATVSFGGHTITVLEVMTVGADALYIGWDSAGISSTPGTYRLFHPGGGELVKVVPSVGQLWIRTATGAPPAGRVEIVGRGGAYGSY
jgi:hypothetical protein